MVRTSHEGTLGRSAAEGEEEVLWPRNGDQEGGLVLSETDTYGGGSDLADEDICKMVCRKRGVESRDSEFENFKLRHSNSKCYLGLYRKIW